MNLQREFFPKVRKTAVPRPEIRLETDVLGQTGSVRATQAAVYGPNWHHDTSEDLIEVWDAGAALSFRDLLPKKDKYKRENLYLRLSIAYRTTENAFPNIRTFSGNHITLPDAVNGAMYEDPHTMHWVTDDMTINVNSIYQGQRLWLQRVDWEWASRETIFLDELPFGDQYLARTKKEVEALYRQKVVEDDDVRNYLIQRIRSDEHFAKRCLAMLSGDAMLGESLVSLYNRLGLKPE